MSNHDRYVTSGNQKHHTMTHHPECRVHILPPGMCHVFPAPSGRICLDAPRHPLGTQRMDSLQLDPLASRVMFSSVSRKQCSKNWRSFAKWVCISISEHFPDSWFRHISSRTLCISGGSVVVRPISTSSPPIKSSLCIILPSLHSLPSTLFGQPWWALEILWKCRCCKPEWQSQRLDQLWFFWWYGRWWSTKLVHWNSTRHL